MRYRMTLSCHGPVRALRLNAALHAERSKHHMRPHYMSAKLNSVKLLCPRFHVDVMFIGELSQQQDSVPR